MQSMSENWLLKKGSKDPKNGPFHCRGAEWLLINNVFKTSWYTGKIDGIFGAQAVEAARKCKYDIGYADEAVQPTFGPELRDFLEGKRKRTPLMLLRARQRRAKFIWPTKPHGTVIGWPATGPHSYVSPPNNWESDNAWDIGVPVHSQILAVADGKIGPQFGPLPDPDPRFHGIRLHLVTADNEFYAAHLDETTPGLGPGDDVKQGEVLGLSGVANGVAHLHLGVKHLIPLSSFK